MRSEVVGVILGTASGPRDDVISRIRSLTTTDVTDPLVPSDDTFTCSSPATRESPWGTIIAPYLARRAEAPVASRFTTFPTGRQKATH
jgi:hypothetical protein